MATTYTADFTAMETVANDLQGASKRIQQGVQDIDAMLKSRLSEWTTGTGADAKGAYQDLQTQWDTAATDMGAQLVTCQIALEEIKARMLAAASSATNSFS